MEEAAKILQLTTLPELAPFERHGLFTRLACTDTNFELVIRLVMEDHKLKKRAIRSFLYVQPVSEEAAPAFKLSVRTWFFANHAPARILIFLESMLQTSLV